MSNNDPISTDDVYKIRPAGRHLLTIGRDLIQDGYAAVVELVKNAYDADSPSVHVDFSVLPSGNGYSLKITDSGHGMSRETVVKKWLVPSTPDKLNRRVSPGGRIMQGRKGVGRYAASILGRDLLLETITEKCERTCVYVEWENFERAEFLDDVDVLVETGMCSEPPGTRLIMTGKVEHLQEWNQRHFDKLRFELKKLTSPIKGTTNGQVDAFQIYLRISGMPGVTDLDEEVRPYPIFDLFDYRIFGSVQSDGSGQLQYQLQKVRNSVDETIPFQLNEPTGCGNLTFDVRVYDREKEAIDSLIGRGLKDEAGNYVGKLQARQLLNEYNGIGVYRNGFRIRPLGDADFDWLRLNEQRVQNPSMRIGNNQAIGVVLIESEEQSGLIEKSARDGLKENIAYAQLKEIARKVIAKLEEKRFTYRRKAGLSRPVIKVERELERLFSFDELKQGIRKKLKKGGVDTTTADEILEIIGKNEDEKNRLAEEIRQTVAVYQGQATLGKIINVILHEGRRPLNYFRNSIPNLHYWHGVFEESEDPKILDKIIPLTGGLAENADVFVKLFGRLDPLAAGKRTNKKPLNVYKAIQSASAVFSEELLSHGISVAVTGAKSVEITAWAQDLYAIFTNLLDNSIFWMLETESSTREIRIEVVGDGEVLTHIDYRDSGPGIEPSLIASEVIFEPQFSTKLGGTGLGLAIAGEAATRNSLELRAFESESGAWFRLQPAGDLS